MMDIWFGQPYFFCEAQEENKAAQSAAERINLNVFFFILVNIFYSYIFANVA